MVETVTSGRSSNQRVDFKRWVPTFFSSHRTALILLWVVAFGTVFLWQQNLLEGLLMFRRASLRPFPKLRPVAFNFTDFGAVGDGVTVNTKAFERAISTISKYAKRGGAQLNVPAGRFLTAPFNLTSHMTLFLAEDAVILAIQDENLWPLMPPLPSYGYGREHKGPRYGSFIHGQNLRDVVITGHNGTINGQGQSWWKKYRQRLLNYTRGPLVQIMWSSDIKFYNVTLQDSPFWTLHPYDCKNVSISNVTILAPIFEAPNTDGIDPDSCEDMVIEDCYISVGDDAVAIKSGWDQYGIAYGRPSRNIIIRNLVVRSMVSAGISIGSEMSGGVSDVTVENVLIWDSRRAVRIKTAPGRGGYVRNIAYRNLTFENVRVGIVIKTDYNEHPDDDYDRKAFPILEDISYIGTHGHSVRVPVRIQGTEDIPVRNVTFRDLSIGIKDKTKHIFQCGYVEGRVIGTVFPAPCVNLDRYDEQERLVHRSESQNVTDIDYEL
ncbi:Glycoside hydrolase, family 28 [Dillenia turbinata]|uniref:Glycoside hydrolase, family 28 n=1 Tax=Dillenia turbinata TaxID=194707 RepID=A0AAN8W3X9_9MAGN